MPPESAGVGSPSVEGVAPSWLHPGPAPSRIAWLMSTRHGGVSLGPYAGFNLGDAVGDVPECVEANRRAWAQACGAAPVYLRQVHGCDVLRLSQAQVTAQARGASAPEADAAFTTEPGIACTVMVADCLPVLFAAPEGRAVGAAHAGWRGLAAGVLERTLEAVCAASGATPAQLQVWLGACIGPSAFEVGGDVREAFCAHASESQRHFQAKAPSAEGQAKWWADLAGLARDRLQQAGVRHLSGGKWCTYSDAERFYSFRRDRSTGRMAASVWIQP